MNYKVVTDRIEVRSLEENNKPRYVVRGTAAISNKKHIYEFAKKSDGSYKTLKSMFTPNFLQSIIKQGKSRKIFIDTQHEMVRDASIKALAKGKNYTEDELKQLDNMLKRKRLPLAKLTDMELHDDRLDIEIEMNPMFREVDEDHRRHFDVIWHNLEQKYLNGLSINFGKFEYDKDESGDTVINDGEVLGISIMDGAAEPDCSINEVAIRAIEEGLNIREGDEKMKDEKEKLEKEKAELEAEKKKLADEKKVAEETKAKTEEEAKAKEIETQKEEQAKAQKELEDKAAKAKELEEENAKLKGEMNSAKGVVKPTEPPAAGTPAGGAEPPKDEKFFKENLAVVTKDHDETIKIKQDGKEPLIDNSMKGFTEMSNLQARANNLTADLNDENAALVKGGRLLDKGPNDIVVQRNPRQ